MSTYKGAAYTVAVSGTGNRYFAVAVDTGEATPATRADHTSWDKVVAVDNPITLVFTMSTDGLTPPAVPNSVVVDLLHSDGTVVADTVTLTSPASGATTVLNVTSTGAAGGLSRVGDFRIRVRAVRTDIGAYDVNSDTQNTKGFLRISPTTMNITVGHDGALDPASYTDNIEVNIDLSHGPGLDLAHRHFDIEARNATTDALYAMQRSEGTDPQNVLMSVDNRFPPSLVPVAIDVVVVAVPSNIAPDSEPTATWITVPTATTGRVSGKKVRKGPVDVDAGIRLNHHLQLNDNVYSPDKDTTVRQTADLGFVTTVVTNARGDVLQDITFTNRLRDRGLLVPPAIDRSVTTDVAGLVPMAAWDSQLPGGLWDHTGTITGPSFAVGLEFDLGESLSLIAANPYLSLIVGCGPSGVGDDVRHLEPGMTTLVGLTGVNTLTGKQLVLDAGTAKAAVCRFNLSLGRAEFLDVDLAWKSVAGRVLHFWPLDPSLGDSNTHVRVFTSDDTWGVADLFILGTGAVQGVPLSAFSKEVVVSGVNNHSVYKFDGPGFVGFPTR